MKRIATLLLLVLLTQVSCNKTEKDCPECFTPPPTFRFEFVDKTSGENLFTNKTLNIEDVSVYDENNKHVKSELITENNINVLDISSIGWTEGPKSYTIELSEDISVKITLNMKEKHDECCTYYEIVEFSVSNYDYEKLDDSNLIVVKL